MQLQLEEFEKDILIEILENEVEELKEEIHHTDDYDFKETLKNKLNSLEMLLSKLKK